MTQQERDVLVKIGTDVKWLKKELTDYKSCQEEHTKDISNLKGEAKVWRWANGIVTAIIIGVLIWEFTAGPLKLEAQPKTPQTTQQTHP
jgi:hypothetical protein